MAMSLQQVDLMGARIAFGCGLSTTNAAVQPAASEGRASSCLRAVSSQWTKRLDLDKASSKGKNKMLEDESDRTLRQLASLKRHMLSCSSVTGNALRLTAFPALSMTPVAFKEDKLFETRTARVMGDLQQLHNVHEKAKEESGRTLKT
jgi:hypothetical protein